MFDRLVEKVCAFRSSKKFKNVWGLLLPGQPLCSVCLTSLNPPSTKLASFLIPSSHPNPPVLTSPSSYSRLCCGAKSPTSGRVQLRQNTDTESPPAKDQTTLPRPDILIDLSSTDMFSSGFQYLPQSIPMTYRRSVALAGEKSFLSG